MQATNYLMRAILNLARGTAMTAPSTFYLALYRGDPTASGTGASEISYTGYARQVCAFSSSSGTSSGYIQNSAQITFPQIPHGVSSQTVTHVAIMDALTDGNMYLYAELADAVSLGTTLQIYFPANALKWTFTGFTQDYRKKVVTDFFKNHETIAGFTPYLALYNSSGTEKNSGGYARQQVSLNLSSSSNRLSNVSNIDFPVATASWGAVAQAAIVDAASSGTKYQSFSFTSFTAGANSQVRVNSGAITITMQDPA